MVASVEKEEDCSVCNDGDNLSFTLTTGGTGTKITEIEKPVSLDNAWIVECYMCKRRKYFKVDY